MDLSIEKTRAQDDIAVDAAQMEKLLRFKGKYPLKRFGLAMVVTRMRGLYNVAPSGQTVVRCAAELNDVLSRHADIMEEDRAWIRGL